MMAMYYAAILLIVSVLNKYIKAHCLCCKANYITQHNFHCGHVVAEAKGGMLHVSNLRPICAVCNNSMGTTDMKEYAFNHFNVEI